MFCVNNSAAVNEAVDPWFLYCGDIFYKSDLLSVSDLDLLKFCHEAMVKNELTLKSISIMKGSIIYSGLN